MKLFILLSILVLSVHIVAALPVKEKKEEEKKNEEESNQNQADVADSIEYERYLKEVVNVLETDPEFRKKIDNATDVDIRSGKIANELEHVNHHVRSKLDEIKRREIERLRLLAMKQFELTNDIDRDHFKISDPRHLDHENPHTFEIEDLKKLILKTSEDLAEADKKRRDDFKEYELQKEFEKREKMREMDEEHRKQYEEELKRQQSKHNKHEKVHHPGNKAQLEEVWEKQDHMDASDFNPKTFFMMHDLDGNNFWDQNEVKALFVKELDKVYQSGLPEDDMRERVEEMERMREHVFREADTNHDNLISLEEFIAQTKREEFNRDPNWDTVDNQPQFTHEEYLEFERRRREEIDRLIAQGMLPPHPNMPYGYHPQMNAQYQQAPAMQQQGQVHPNVQYQQHPNAVPVQHGQQHGYDQQMNAQHQQAPVMHQQAQVHPNIQYQQHPNAVPVKHGQQHGYDQQMNTQYQQAPAMQQQGQVHPNIQYQQHPNAVPVQHGQQHGYDQQMNAQYQQAPAMQQQGQLHPNIQYQQLPNAVPIQNVKQKNQQPSAGQPIQTNQQPTTGQQVPSNAAIPNQSSQIDQKEMQPNQHVVPVANNPNAINANDKH